MTFVALAASLASLSGLVDVICLLRFRAFAALQTGNIVHLGIGLAEEHGDALAEIVAFSLAVMASHVAGVVGFCYVADKCSRPVLVAAPALGLLTAAAGVLDGSGDEGCKWACCLVAASFGAMNFCTSPNTPLAGKLFTMVSLATGNLQKTAKTLYRASAGHSFSEHELQSARVGAAVVVGTFFGALVGGAAYAWDPAHLAFWLLPAGAAQCVSLVWHDRLLRPAGQSPLAEPLHAGSDIP